MTLPPAFDAASQQPHHPVTPEDEDTFLGRDLQERFGWLLLGYNEAHHDLLDASGPDRVRRTDEPGLYEIRIICTTGVATLTAAVIREDGRCRLDPIDFRMTFRLPMMPVFSYDRDCKDAYVIRLMTCWLERAFLVHEAAILESIHALDQGSDTARP